MKLSSNSLNKMNLNLILTEKLMETMSYLPEEVRGGCLGSPQGTIKWDCAHKVTLRIELIFWIMKPKPPQFQLDWGPHSPNHPLQGLVPQLLFPDPSLHPHQTPGTDTPLSWILSTGKTVFSLWGEEKVRETQYLVLCNSEMPPFLRVPFFVWLQGKGWLQDEFTQDLESRMQQ